MARIDLDRILTDAHDPPQEPLGCPVCLSHRSDFPAPAEDHVPALLAAIRDVVIASTDLDAKEVVPRRLWLAIQRAADVVQDVSPAPF